MKFSQIIESLKRNSDFIRTVKYFSTIFIFQFLALFSLAIGINLTIQFNAYLIKCIIYAIFIIFFIICLKTIKISRNKLYVFMGITYFIYTLSMYSNGYTDNILYGIVYYISSWMPHEEISQNDFLIFLQEFFYVIKESMLSFIIFDTIFQAHESSRKICENIKIRQNEYVFKEYLSTIIYLIDYLENFKTSNTFYKTKISNDFLCTKSLLFKKFPIETINELELLIDKLKETHNNEQFLNDLQKLYFYIKYNILQ